MSDLQVRRGQIWMVDWEPHRGSEQGGWRPSLVVQCNEANELEHYRNTIVVPVSSTPPADEMLHVPVEPSRLNGLTRASIVRCEQILTISRSRLRRLVGQIEPRDMKRVEQGLRDVLGL